MRAAKHREQRALDDKLLTENHLAEGFLCGGHLSDSLFGILEDGVVEGLGFTAAAAHLGSLKSNSRNFRAALRAALAWLTYLRGMVRV
jgi:hypothetical protein